MIAHHRSKASQMPECTPFYPVVIIVMVALGLLYLAVSGGENHHANGDEASQQQFEIGSTNLPWESTLNKRPPYTRRGKR